MYNIERNCLPGCDAM